MTRAALRSTATRAADSPAEAELVAAARSGDQQAFGRLVERYRNLACSVAYAITGSFVQSEELAQEALVLAWRRLPDLEEPYDFRAWLYRITQNVSRSSLRKRRELLLSEAGLKP